MPNAKKTQAVEQLKEQVAKAKSIAFAQYTGMNVKQQTELRRKIRAAGGELTIAKNRLVNLALGRPEGMDKLLEEQLVTLFSYTDEVSALKALTEYAKENDLPVLKAGYFEGKVLNRDEVIALSKTPGKDELIGMLLRTLQGPAHGLRNVVDAIPRNLVYALDAIAKKG